MDVELIGFNLTNYTFVLFCKVCYSCLIFLCFVV